MVHPAPVEGAGAGRWVQEPDQNRVVTGPLEEDEEQRLGLVEDPISEELQARVSEPGRSTGPPLSVQETPTSKPGTESAMPAEVSEPDQPDHQNQEIRTLDAAQPDSA